MPKTEREVSVDRNSDCVGLCETTYIHMHRVVFRRERMMKELCNALLRWKVI